MRTVKIIVTLFVLLVLAVGGGGYFFFKYQKLQKSIGTTSQEDTASLLEKLSRHVILPEGETPTIATVTDVESLKNQEFFKNAKNGYKVIVYANAKMAILYDSELDKIVTIAPLNTADNTADEQTPTPQADSLE